VKPIPSMECVAKKFLKLPNIQKYEVSALTGYGFNAVIEMDDGFIFEIHVYTMLKSYPSSVMQLLEKREKDKRDYVLVSPYISETEFIRPGKGNPFISFPIRTISLPARPEQ